MRYLLLVNCLKGLKSDCDLSKLLMSLILFRHGFTARFARVAEIAEELFF
jgi:hypothetical protein